MHFVINEIKNSITIKLLYAKVTLNFQLHTNKNRLNLFLKLYSFYMHLLFIGFFHRSFVETALAPSLRHPLERIFIINIHNGRFMD
jgi:hypothetical protein